jgi:hypothetical protein
MYVMRHNTSLVVSNTRKKKLLMQASLALNSCLTCAYMCICTATGFCRGLQPAVMRHCVYTAARVCLYEDIRDSLSRASGHDGGGDASPVVIKLVSGFTAGAR